MDGYCAPGARIGGRLTAPSFKRVEAASNVSALTEYDEKKLVAPVIPL